MSFSYASQSIANDSTMGIYRVQEHIRKRIPKIVKSRIRLKYHRETEVGGYIQDARDVTQTVKSLNNDENLETIEKLLRKCIDLSNKP